MILICMKRTPFLINSARLFDTYIFYTPLDFNLLITLGHRKGLETNQKFGPNAYLPRNFGSLEELWVSVSYSFELPAKLLLITAASTMKSHLLDAAASQA